MARLSDMDEKPLLTFAECLSNLVQSALDKKNSADDSETARKWAIVRTELEKVHAYVLTLEE